ncbi:MAG: hypothetical protein ACLUYS_05195 [Allobaculum sp.]|uniref:hypothetical protein n=2 Tax=Erysipelotrichaceae TaxID=128827 RepID=UPI001E282EC8|nr:hypothetical protein [Allobaculum fili]
MKSEVEFQPANIRKTSKYLPWLLIILGVVSLLVIPLIGYKQVSIPQIYQDEFGYWGDAAFFNGQNWSTVISTIPYYSFGYSLILKLFISLTGSYTNAYALAQMVNGLWLALTFLLLIRLIKLLYPKTIKSSWAIFFAYISVVYASNILNSHFTWPECFLSLLVVMLTVLFVKLLKTYNLIYFISISVLCAYIYYVHQRMIGFVLSVFIILVISVFFQKTKRDAILKLLIFFLTFGIIYFLFSLLKTDLINNLWVSSPSSNVNNISGQAGNIRYLFTISGIRDFLLSFSGKLFYLFTATFFVIPLLLLRSVTRLFKWIQGKSKRHQKTGENACADELALVYLFVLLSFLLSAGISSVSMITPTTISHVVYGRYLEPLYSVGLALGFAELFLRKMSFTELLILMGIYALTVLSVSWQCNQGELRWRAPVNNSAVTWFVKENWIELRNCLLLTGIGVVLLFMAERKRILYCLILTIMGIYWIVTGNQAYKDHVSDWGAYQEDNVAISEYIRNFENQHDENIQVVIVNSDIGRLPSRNPGNGLQFLNPNAEFEVYSEWDQSLAKTFENGDVPGLLVTSEAADIEGLDEPVYTTDHYQIYILKE